GAYAGRDWLAASRWPDDQGQRYLLCGSGLLPIRTVDDPRAWSRMNLVDICVGTPFDLPRDSGTEAAARAASVPHLLVAAPGYFTVPVGVGADPGALVEAAVELARVSELPLGFAYLPPE